MKIIYMIIALTAASLLFSRVILTEAMFNPAGNENHDEFIEIYNDSDLEIDLSGWSIGDQDEIDMLKKYNGFPDMILKPRRYCVVMDSSYYLNSVYYEDLIPDSVLRVMINDGSFGAYGLSNTNAETVILMMPDSSVSDTYTYTIDQPENYSDERTSFDRDIWTNSKTARGTPGFRNSVFPLDFDLELKISSYPYSIDPSVPNTFILKVTNTGLYTTEVFTLRAESEGITESEEVYSGVLSPQDSVFFNMNISFTISGTVKIRFSLECEADDDTSDNSAEMTVFVPFPAPPLVLNEFMSIPAADQCEFIEVYNISGSEVNLGDFGISDEVRTRVVYFPQKTVPAGSYFVMAKSDSIFNFYNVDAEKVFVTSSLAVLNNETDKIFLLTRSGGVTDSIAYSGFGATGKSVEKRSPELSSDVLSNWTYSETSGTPTKKNSAMPFDFDLKISRIIPPAIIDPTGFNRFGVTVKNIGYQHTASFSVSAYADGVYNSSSEITAAPAPDDSVTVETDIFFERSGTVGIMFEAEVSGDQNTQNNSLETQIFVPFQSPPLTINEFMKNPSAGQCEYIEIVNTSDETIDLSDFGISDENKANAVFFPYFVSLPGDLIVMAKDSLIFNFESILNSNVFVAPKLAALNNSSDNIFILSKNGSVIDSISYKGFDNDAGRSIEKINPKFSSSDLSNWVYCVHKGTPTAKNSVFQDPGDIGTSASFRISPKTATPNGDGDNDNLVISYEFDSAYVYLTMKIFNIKGQLIAMPKNGDYSTSSGSFVWNCLSESGKTIDTGAYICLLKAKDDQGKVTELKEVFYIAK